MSSSSKRQETHSSSIDKSDDSNHTRHNSQLNEEEDLNNLSNSDTNSNSEQFGDEGLLQKIESMPSLDSEFLMSPNLDFPQFSKNEALQASDDIKNMSENSEKTKNSNNFPSIKADELHILDSPVNRPNKQNDDETESSGSFSPPDSNIQTDKDANKNSMKVKARKSKNKPKKFERATFMPQINTSKVFPLSKKSSFQRISKDAYAYDFENDDDDFDPSFELPMPMPVSPSSPESHSKRRKTLPLKRSSLMENEREAIEKANAIFNSKFECEQTLLKTCQICEEKIEKDGAFINGFYYHKKCLACSKCGKKLGQLQKCFMYQENLMCEDCVHVDLSQINVCKICGQKIFNQSEEVELPNKQKVHSSCTSCYMCGKQLPLDQMIIIDDDKHENVVENEPIKDDDENPQKKSKLKMKKKSKTKSKNKTKPKTKQNKKTCNERRTSNFSYDTIFVDKDGVKMSKFVCKKCHAHLMKEQVCCKCNRPILENIVVKNQRAFHRRCFRCEHPGCNQQLFGNSYVIHHNTFLCWQHGKIYSISCSYCKQLFKSYETDRIKWHSKLYHKSCFVCRVCGTTLDPQTCKSIHGRPHCDECFQLRLNEGDCDEKGQSLYVHYNQIHNNHRKNKNKKNIDDNEEEEEENVDQANSYSSTSNTSDIINDDFDLTENNMKKHTTHLHIAKAAEKRKNRFFVKYHVNINWPEYCEKNFEKAQPYHPETDKNVFKKF